MRIPVPPLTQVSTYDVSFTCSQWYLSLCSLLTTIRYNTGGKNWKLVGDNLDLTIKQHHFFHSIAVQDRINTAHLDDSRPQQLVSSLTPFDFVPSSSHYKQLCSDLIILVSRIVVAEFPAFQYMSEAVPSHILHQYPSEMAQPSVVVSY